MKPQSKNIDLTTFEFPSVDAVDIVFPTASTIPALLEEAKLRGFLHGRTPYNDLFGKLFYNGGKVVFKKNVDDGFKNRAWLYLRSFMGSWAPRHEHKEAICAMILSEICEPELAKEN